MSVEWCRWIYSPVVRHCHQCSHVTRRLKIECVVEMSVFQLPSVQARVRQMFWTELIYTVEVLLLMCPLVAIRH